MGETEGRLRKNLSEPIIARPINDIGGEMEARD